MTSTQTRSQKGRAAPKMDASIALAAARATRSNGKKHPHPAPRISAEEREILIAKLAYSRAEKRGFAPGAEWQDWFEAEAEVERLLD